MTDTDFMLVCLGLAAALSVIFIGGVAADRVGIFLHLSHGFGQLRHHPHQESLWDTSRAVAVVHAVADVRGEK